MSEQGKGIKVLHHTFEFYWERVDQKNGIGKKKRRNKVIHIDDTIQYKDNFKQDNAVPFKMNRNVL